MRNVAVHAGSLDLLRGLPAARSADPFCGRRGSVPPRGSHDGRPGGAAASSAEGPFSAAGVARLFSAAHLVALSLFIYRDPVAVRFAERSGLWSQLRCALHMRTDRSACWGRPGLEAQSRVLATNLPPIVCRCLVL